MADQTPIPLFELPPWELELILTACLVVGATPGEIVRLTLVCKAAKGALHSLDGFWANLLRRLGNRAEFARGQTHGFLSTYSQYMATRTRLRRLLRQLVFFHSYPSCESLLQHGLCPREINALEDQHGVQLPLEIWELYRFANGQLPIPGARCFYSQRFISLEDCLLEGQQSHSDAKSAEGERQWPLTEPGLNHFRFNARGQIIKRHGMTEFVYNDTLCGFISRMLR